MPSVSIGLSLRGQLNNSVYSPNKLFASSEQGVWYDPSDITTLFQDSAGTTPVTAAGQPVGKMLDKSGSGFHATQATAGQRPTYQVDSTGHPYLSFDGVDDGMVTGTITPSIDKAQVFVGLRANSNTVGEIIDFASVFGMDINGSAATNGTSGATGGGGNRSYFVNVTFPVPNTLVLAFDRAGTTALTEIPTVLVNGVIPTGLTRGQEGVTAIGNFPAGALNIGKRNTGLSPLNGRIYSMIIRFGANLTAGQITSTESWVNGKTGAY